MASTPERHYQDQVFAARVAQIVDTFNEIFGLCQAEVVVQALANWLAQIIFNTVPHVQQRRQLIATFNKQLEQVLNNLEKGNIPSGRGTPN